MKFNKYLICALFLVLICCIGAASAAEADDVVAADDAIDEAVSEAVDVSDEVVDDSLGVSEEPALSDGENNGSDLNEVVIYVGQNRTDDGGNGSYENPFSTFDLAQSNVNGEDKVIVNVFNGNYTIGSLLKFNTSNLFIQGIGDNVIIKNRYSGSGYTQAFGLVSDSANFTISNIIFDASNWNVGVMGTRYFMPFFGNANLGIFINCSFINFYKTSVTGPELYDAEYIGTKPCHQA